MSDLKQLEEQLASEKTKLAFKDKVEKLLNDPTFREVILEDFCSKEVVRNIELGTDPAMQDAQMRADCMEAARAGADLRRYLQARVGMGRNAEKAIKQIEAEIEDILQNGDDD